MLQFPFLDLAKLKHLSGRAREVVSKARAITIARASLKPITTVKTSTIPKVLAREENKALGLEPLEFIPLRAMKPIGSRISRGLRSIFIFGLAGWTSVILSLAIANPSSTPALPSWLSNASIANLPSNSVSNPLLALLPVQFQQYTQQQRWWQLQQLGLYPQLAPPVGGKLPSYWAKQPSLSPTQQANLRHLPSPQIPTGQAQLGPINSLSSLAPNALPDRYPQLLLSATEPRETLFDYSQQQQGWYYYNWQSPEKKQEAEERQLQQLLTSQGLTPAELSTPEPRASNLPPAKVPSRITTAWLKENLPKYLEQAMDNPSQENVLAYLYLQAYSVQKANVFSEQAKLVSQGNDLLDSNANFPLLSGARQYREQLAKHIREQLFTRQQGKVSLLLLVGKDFESRSFAQLVGLASLKFNWKLTLANIYGEYLPDLANYQQITDREQVLQFAQKYKAQLFPTLWIVAADDTQQLVSGAVDMEELEARLLRYLYRKQLINTAEYNLGRGVLFDPKASEAEIVELVNQQLSKSKDEND